MIWSNIALLDSGETPRVPASTPDGAVAGTGAILKAFAAQFIFHMPESVSTVVLFGQIQQGNYGHHA